VRIISRGVVVNLKSTRPFRGVVEYEYEFGGNTYRSQRFYPDSELVSADFASKEEAEFRIAEVIDKEAPSALVKRTDPNYAFLEKLPLTPLFIVIAVNLVLLLITPVLLFSLFRRYQEPSIDKPKRALRPLSSINFAPYWAHVPTLSAAGVLSISFVLATGWILYRSLYQPYQLSEQALTWAKTECRVLESHLIPDPDGSSHETILVEYEWENRGRKYRGSRYDFYHNTMPSGEARKIAGDLQTQLGKTTSCYVNPKTPSEAVIFRHWKYPRIQEIAVLVAAFAISLVFALTFLTLFIKRLTTRSRTRFDVIAASETTLHQVDSITTRRRLKAVFGISLSLLLIGLTYVWIDGFWTNAFAWYVSTVFTLLALPLLVLTAFSVSKTYTALKQLSAPTPKLFFVKREVCAGESFEVRWEITSHPEQVESLTFELRGSEIATSGNGEDTDTFVQVFFKGGERFEGEAAKKGKVGMVVPRIGPPSFSGKFNHVRWEIGLELRLKDRESLGETFNVTVLPPEVPHAPTQA